jgi:hypothetical protein
MSGSRRTAKPRPARPKPIARGLIVVRFLGYQGNSTQVVSTVRRLPDAPYLARLSHSATPGSQILLLPDLFRPTLNLLSPDLFRPTRLYSSGNSTLSSSRAVS